MKPFRRVAAAFAVLLSPVTAHAYSALYVFGDSLSDAGNVFLGTSAPGSPVSTQPASPYANGQFSNGPTWVQDLSVSLGLGAEQPSLAGGNDYAFGGATTGYAASNNPAVPTLQGQVAAFSAAHGSVATSTALYSVWIGANDLTNILVSGENAGQMLGNAQGAAAVETSAIAALVAEGAKNFVVPLVPNLGLTPDSTAAGAAAAAAATALSQVYDAALTAGLNGLVTADGIAVTIVDTYSLLDAAIADPAAYRFSNVTAGCYTGPYTGGGTVCANPSQYLFWDGEHPTAVGHALIAAAAEADLPEPGTLATLSIGLAGIAALRRRRSAVCCRLATPEGKLLG
nr:SGNH/GDSL hydrolase family protein [uncultured Rhodopila sp.]